MLPLEKLRWHRTLKIKQRLKKKETLKFLKASRDAKEEKQKYNLVQTVKQQKMLAKEKELLSALGNDFYTEV